MIISGWQKSKVSSPKIRNDSLYVWEGGYSISSLSLCTRTTRIFMTKMTKNGTDVGELCRQSWMVILKSAPHKANFENDIPHHRDCQWSTIGRDWNWIKRKLFLLLWSPSFLLLLSNCCNKDTVGCNVQCDVCWVSQSLILSSCGNFLRVVRYRVSKKGTAHEYLTPKVMINRSTRWYLLL